MTKVGSSGISLSGGQKQRLALARAVYSRKEVVMLDDVFSGLDADSEERIFTNLLSKQGLFRRMGTTVLLATHAVHRISYADLIVAMNNEGTIAEQGNLSDLEAKGGYVTLLKARYRSDSSSENSEVQRKDTVRLAATELEQSTEVETIAEELTRQNGDLSLYAYFIGSVHWSSTALWFSCFILNGVSLKMCEYVVNLWTESTSEHGRSVDAFYLGIYGLLATFTIVSLVGGAYHYLLYFAAKSAQTLHQRLVGSVMNAPLAFFTSTDIGTTTNRSAFPD